MQKGVEEVRRNTHRSYLVALSLYRVTQTNAFEEAYNATSDVQKEFAVQLIRDLKKDQLVEWIRAQLKEHNLLCVLPMKDLRSLGQELSIPNYCTLSRPTLIGAIENERTNSSDLQGNGTVVTVGSNGTHVNFANHKDREEEGQGTSRAV